MTKLVDAEPAVFATVHVTVVAPMGNVSPDTTATPAPVSQVGVPPVAVTVNVTGAPAADVASTVMSPGPVIVGASGQAGREIVASAVSVSGRRVPPFGVTVAESVRVTGSPHAVSFLTRIESPMLRKVPSAAATRRNFIGPSLTACGPGPLRVGQKLDDEKRPRANSPVRCG